MSLPPLYCAAHLRDIEQSYAASKPASALMEIAGQAAAALAAELALDGLPILVLAGSGNNGGDALVAARYLKQQWHAVDLMYTGEAEPVPPEAKTAYRAWLACGGNILNTIPSKRYGLVIDGLFGIGLTRALDSTCLSLVQQVNALDSPVLALDIPSGLHADTGQVLGAAITADVTLTFLGLKPGLFTLNGADYAGQVHVCDLGVAPALFPPALGHLVNARPCRLPERRHNSHKGSNGHVAVLGGASGMVGAALLAARAALLAGSGRVSCHFLAPEAPAVDPATPELMLHHSNDEALADNINCIIAGPGIGRTARAARLLRACAQHPATLVLDADALHLLHNDQALIKSLHQHGRAVLTPHPGEAAALLQCEVADIQADRITAAKKIAARYQTVTVLKGSGSIIATPDGRWFINSSGNPGLATAGMGDVLAGVIGALIAQGLNTEQATLLGVYLHGQAADTLVAEGIGPTGLTASELIMAIRQQLNNEQ